MTPEQEAAAAAFLIELTALSKKHGIVVQGCGCCGSPRLAPLGAGGKLAPDPTGEYLPYDSKRETDVVWSKP